MPIKLKEPQIPQTMKQLECGDVFRFTGPSPYLRGTVMLIDYAPHLRFVALTNGAIIYNCDNQDEPVIYLGKFEEEEEEVVEEAYSCESCACNAK